MSDVVDDDPQAGLKRALSSAVAHARLQRAKGRTGKSVAKLSGTKRKKRKKTKLASKDKEVNAVVSPFTQQHGIYEATDFKLIETIQGGKKKENFTRVVVNRGGTAVERWHRTGRLEDRQMAAVAFYTRNYCLHYGMPPRVVANWSSVVSGMVRSASEFCNNARLDAKQLLRLLDQDIFFRRTVDDFNVWQNVVIHDEAAGVAGTRLGFKNKPAEAIALFIVQSVSHEIATLVIDRPPRDMESLLLDLDAPRRPRP